MHTVWLDPHKIASLPYNPANRTDHKDLAFKALYEEIKADGQKVPGTVVPNRDPDEWGDEYTHVLAYGHRRRECAIMLGRRFLVLIDVEHTIEELLAAENLTKNLNARDRLDRLVDGCDVPLSKWEQSRLDRLVEIFGSRKEAITFLRPEGTGKGAYTQRLGTSVVDLIERATRLLMAHGTKLSGFVVTTPAQELALKKRIAVWMSDHRSKTLLSESCRASHGAAAAKRIWDAVTNDRPIKPLLISKH